MYRKKKNFNLYVTIIKIITCEMKTALVYRLTCKFHFLNLLVLKVKTKYI